MWGTGDLVERGRTRYLEERWKTGNLEEREDRGRNLTKI